ncbi:MAG: UbiX family flavin prenyltransferase [Selenomonadaceae bacterium]|nr:UbiX family flavin prenyltransferase [Selenomonadaceae bacterium]MBQ7629208.1 UbiX family flavin prenyltransferase [Selenomonadaceae bacterium]
MRIIVGITGASGIVIAVTLLNKLKEIEGVETHLIITDGGELTIRDETNFEAYDIKRLADYVYDVHEMDASIASGSFLVDGMVVVPCTMKTVAGIVCGYSDNLLLRAADVCVKEKRKLILVPREMPFSRIHLRNMKELANLGVVIMPPVMTFYNTDMTIESHINHIINKILLQLGLPADMVEWTGGDRN